MRRRVIRVDVMSEEQTVNALGLHELTLVVITRDCAVLVG